MTRGGHKPVTDDYKAVDVESRVDSKLHQDIALAADEALRILAVLTARALGEDGKDGRADEGDSQETIFRTGNDFS